MGGDQRVGREREESRRAWDIFNSDGHYLTRLWLTINPGIFVEGKMYRLHSDEETGFRTVRRYRVTWSDEDDRMGADLEI